MPAALILAAIPSPSSNAIELGPLSIRAYGVAIAVGVVAAMVALVLRHRGSHSCQQAADRLQSFLDGEVDPSTALRLEEHLERCRRCGMEADVYRDIKQSLSRTTPAVPELTLRRLRHFGEGLGTRVSRNPQGTGR